MTWATKRAYTALLPGLVEGLKDNGPEPVHRGVKSLGWQYHATCMGSHGAPNFRHVKCQTYVHWGKTRVLSDNFRAYIEKSGFEHPNSRTSLLSAECSLGFGHSTITAVQAPHFAFLGVANSNAQARWLIPWAANTWFWASLHKALSLPQT